MPEVRRFIIQTCGAVKYLHHRNIIHRDLKTGNLFLDQGMNVKVGDFGLAAMLVGKNDMGARRTTMCGTPNYLAPEILEKGGRGHNEKVDLWAIGIIAYTLAVGKAPFHAAKREEIYKKLQNREYEWPDASKCANDISQDLKDLVSSLLVHEDDRPVPDKIVSHTFFRLAFIPEHLDNSCVLKKPVWNVRPPSPEALQRGYSESWMKVCKISGVGEYAPGRVFPLQQAKRIVSVVKDVEKEIKAGRAPVVPIPADMVYRPYPDQPNWLQPNVGNLDEIVEEREPSPEQKLSEISGNGKTDRSRKIEAKLPSRLKENAVPARAPPVDRTAEKPTAADPKRTLSKRRKPDEPRPVPAVSRPQSRKPDESKPAPAVSRPQSRKPINETTPDAPPLTTVRQRSQEKMADPAPALTRQPSRRGKPVRVDSAMISKTQEEKDSRVPEKKECAATEPPVATVRVVSRTKVPQAIATSRPAQSKVRSSPECVVISSDPKVPSQQSNDDKIFPSSHPETVLVRAMQLRDNIASALKGKLTTSKRPSRAPKLPFVTKWVDYSRKLGIGYVLNEGSIGCILSATSKYPVTHVVVRNGLAYLHDSKKEVPTIVPGMPIEFYECDTNGLKRAAVDTERSQGNLVLWTKFGRYMCQQLGTQDKPASTRAPKTSGEPDVFVRFYERLGSVGIWGFSDGCFQVNFPDHTKLVLSADGKSCSYTSLSVEAMQHLIANGSLPYKYIRDREVLSGSVAGLLYGNEADGSVMEANEFKAKLSFMVEVLDEWLTTGGLGCSPAGAARLRYDGPCSDEGKKVDWVTVGRSGGDASARSAR